MQEPTNPRTQQVFAVIVDQKEFSRSYSDQTGLFPVQSSIGNNYIFIFYDFDSNVIISITLRNRQGSTICDAWFATHTNIQANGYAPQLHILDKECPKNTKPAFTKHAVNFLRIYPHNHRQNAAERAIQTWKNHFIAGLSACDPSFPLSEWDQLLPQCDIKLNQIRSYRRQQKLLAYACLFGKNKFNKNPLSVPGTKVLIHKNSQQRRSFVPHGLGGFNLGPALQHYT